MSGFKGLSDEELTFLEKERRRLQEESYFMRSRIYVEPEKTFWEKLDRRDDYAPGRQGGIKTEGEAIAVGLVITIFGFGLLLCFIGLVAGVG